MTHSTWHDVVVPVSPVLSPHRLAPRSRTRRPAVRIAAALLLVIIGSLSLTSCMERSPYVGDRLWGELVIAAKASGDSKGPQIEIPQSMAGSVVADAYSENGMVGTRVTYSALPVGQFNELGDLLLEAYPNSPVSMDLSTKRNGDVVRFRGSTDLSSLTAGQDLVSLTVQFAGPISATNGKQSSDDTATWTPDAGKVTDLSAEANYADPGTAAFGDWTWLLAGITLAVVLIVGGVAYTTRDASPRAGRT